MLAEFAAAFALWQADLGWLLFDESVLNLALTTLWVVGLVNAFNLMDNLDGAAGTVGGVSAAGVGVLAATQGETAIAAMAFALAGACAGFLRFNLARPSRVFLGDGGSMPMGFLLAAGADGHPGHRGLRNGRRVRRRPARRARRASTRRWSWSRASAAGLGVLHRRPRPPDAPPAGAPRHAADAWRSRSRAPRRRCALLGFVLFDSTIVTVFSAATGYVLLGAATIAALEWPYLRAEARAAAEAALSPALAPAQQESGS